MKRRKSLQRERKPHILRVPLAFESSFFFFLSRSVLLSPLGFFAARKAAFSLLTSMIPTAEGDEAELAKDPDQRHKVMSLNSQVKAFSFKLKFLLLLLSKVSSSFDEKKGPTPICLFSEGAQTSGAGFLSPDDCLS